MPSLKRDPSRTTMLRRRFVADMTRRFKKLSKSVWTLVVTDDVFGLEIAVPLKLNRQDDGLLANRQEWRFRNDGEKIQEFQKWLKKEVDTGILTVDGLGEPWTNDYVDSSYRKGWERGYNEVRGLDNTIIGYEGTRDQFLEESFNQPETISKIQSIYTRTFSELKGVSAAMDQQMSRILADGLTAGEGPAVLARKLQKNISKITKTRAWVLARTEVIRAHAEGQLDSFDRLGIEEVDAMVEWSTAGDDRVCARCLSLGATTYTIKKAHGLIPEHPNCRCAWIPVSPKIKRKK